jgi:HSP20 family protein
MTEKTTELQKVDQQMEEVESEAEETIRTVIPQVDIYEVDDKVILLADMPGVGDSTVDITLEKQLLTIYGRVDVQWPDGYDLAFSDTRPLAYERTFALSDAVDKANIEATINNGVLRLTLPKAEMARTRKIAVRVE